ncbi:hypothetical protein G6F50_012955 [Rhizopus delemar]|uniref:Uncharacterized protein n=1 Tax=Rhizopus delemar TaxID=936053 RepID=A0A9P7CI92_9FUNG|nr:hypothetical protein G6F50_012955 [Rhizopus delemar]
MGFSPQRTEPATGRIKAVHRHRFIDHAHRCACDQFRIAIEVDVLQTPPRVAVRIRRAGQRLALARRRKLNRDVAVLLRIGVRLHVSGHLEPQGFAAVPARLRRRCQHASQHHAQHPLPVIHHRSLRHRGGTFNSERYLDRLPRPQHRLMPGLLLPRQADRLDVGPALRGVLVQHHQHLGAQAVGRSIAAEQPLAVGIEHGQAIREARGHFLVQERAPLRLADGVGLRTAACALLFAHAEIQLAAHPAVAVGRACRIALQFGGGGRGIRTGRLRREAGAAAGSQQHGKDEAKVFHRYSSGQMGGTGRAGSVQRHRPGVLMPAGHQLMPDRQGLASAAVITRR